MEPCSQWEVPRSAIPVPVQNLIRRNSNFVFLQCPCIYGENGDGVQGYGREETDERASSSYPDLLIESINVLKTAQEALENVDCSKIFCNADLSYKTGLEIWNNCYHSNKKLKLLSLAFPPHYLIAVKLLLKFKEISQPTSVKFIILDANPEFTDAGAEFRETSFVQLPISEGIPDSPWTLLSKLMEIENRDEQRELENLFVQRIEAEVEYILI
ncbi:hypothetical protein SASPL_152708 [Salvia splendens]|uniref:Uncharacterized protein n=1 Tax=Salvia splendens TaxID=180675 RepID=A0A8X8W3R9_SALSN|nr:hypothetical protein SASPL_152708 [Salvia splendens]